MRRQLRPLVPVVALLALAGTPSAQVVIQSVTVRVESGQEAEYGSRVAQSQKILDRLGQGERLEVWDATLAGDDANNTLVGVVYPSLDAFAAATAPRTRTPSFRSSWVGSTRSGPSFAQAS